MDSKVDRVEKVLFVCTANICRSPMAEAIFNALMENEGLSFYARSAGTSALTGRELAPNARLALEEIGVYANDHRARQVNETLLEDADLVLTMSPRHVEELGQLYGNLSGRIYTLPEYTGGVGDIPDPYGHSMFTYRACARQLLDYLDSLVKRL